MTPREYGNACEGYNKKSEYGFQTSWERARWIATVIVNVNSTKKQFKPSELMKFPWEGKEADIKTEIDLIKERRKWRQEQR